MNRELRPRQKVNYAKLHEQGRMSDVSLDVTDRDDSLLASEGEEGVSASEEESEEEFPEEDPWEKEERGLLDRNARQ